VKRTRTKTPAAAPTLLNSPEGELANGIWPKSVAFWFGLGYMALYVIRPWEALFPWMMVLRPERTWALATLLAVFLDKRSRLRTDGLTYSMILLLLVVGLTVAFSIDRANSWDTFWPFLTMAAFVFMMQAFLTNIYHLSLFILGYLFILSLYFSKALWEYFVHGQHRYTMGVIRLSGIEGTFGGPNNLAMTLVVSLPLIYLLWNHKEYLSASWPDKWKVRLRRFLKFHIPLTVLALVLTNSRSGFLGFMVFLLLMWWGRPGFARKAKVMVACILGLALLWAAIPEANKGRIKTIWEPESGPANAQVSAEGRIIGFLVGIEMFQEKPIAGVGYGNYIKYRVENLDGLALQPHNLIGQLLGETGILGALGFSTFLIVALAGCGKLKRWSKMEDGADGEYLKELAKAMKSCIILLFIMGGFGHNFARYNWYWTGAYISASIYGYRAFIASRSKNARRLKAGAAETHMS